MDKDNKRVTIKMISEKSGLSAGTVDRVLNKREGVSEKSRQHILKIAEELGYRPNKFASALGRKKELRIGIIYPEKPEDFYKDITLGIELAVEELQDYGVRVDTFRYPTFSPVHIKECFSSIDISLYDGFAVNPAGGNIISNYIDQFIDQGKPTITFNTDAPTSSRIFYFGSNSFQSGMMAAEMLSSIMNETGNVLVLGNLSRMSPFLERLNGFLEYMQLYSPDIHINICTDCNPGYDYVEKSLTDFLSTTPNIQGIFCTGYSSTVGAINALTKLDRKDIKLTGYDVTPTTAKAIQENWCNVLLHQYPFRQGHQTAHLLVKHLLEGWTPPKQQIYLDAQIVIKSNVENYRNNKKSYLMK
ncbi:LacI family DNA-binding transcriptional regulator [Clostridium sp. Marseille-P299]|uniref:LacI family DNA-binding transcriptional regulator n=1 Tax=Clostridium sp. Marseille-P299 TaxID=1805477 RepID=UPI00082AE767|nr:LacI family DNA-binding transcriptional regulator [Clostridium sp. Marseille-P299]